MAITKLEKRFGALAVEKGFITVEQLIKAMDIQIFENLQEEKHRLIGDILFEEGFITKKQIDEMLGSLGNWSSPAL
jgi:hypothetical protein